MLIEFFRTVPYLDELELSYQIYGTQNRGKGIAPESVRLLTKYLFERSKVNRPGGERRLSRFAFSARSRA
jgi:RimJ/RimL family protein N-acetyltransferase